MRRARARCRRSAGAHGHGCGAGKHAPLLLPKGPDVAQTSRRSLRGDSHAEHGLKSGSLSFTSADTGSMDFDSADDGSVLPSLEPFPSTTPTTTTSRSCPPPAPSCPAGGPPRPPPSRRLTVLTRCGWRPWRAPARPPVSSLAQRGGPQPAFVPQRRSGLSSLHPTLEHRRRRAGVAAVSVPGVPQAWRARRAGNGPAGGVGEP